jgi:hypothetical protein
VLALGIELAILIANMKGRLVTKNDCATFGTPHPFQDLGIVATGIDTRRRIRVVSCRWSEAGSGGFVVVIGLDDFAHWDRVTRLPAVRPLSMPWGTDILKLIY